MKTNLIIFLVFLLSCAEGFAQETKFVSKKTKIDVVDYFEEYYVLKTDASIKEGTYVRYRSGRTGPVVLETGNYKNGDKVGLWETYYDPNRSYQTNIIKEKGHYANGKRNGLWMFFHVDTVAAKTKTDTFGKKNKPDSVNIYIDHGAATLRLTGMYINDKKVGEWTSFDTKGKVIQKYDFSKGTLSDKSLGDSINYNTNRVAIFLGGRAQLEAHLYNELRKSSVFDDLPTSRPDSVAAQATFIIVESGNIKNILLSESTAPKRYNGELLRLISTTEGFWIPAVKNAKKAEYVARMTLAVVTKKVNSNHFELHLSFKLNDE